MKFNEYSFLYGVELWTFFPIVKTLKNDHDNIFIMRIISFSILMLTLIHFWLYKKAHKKIYKKDISEQELRSTYSTPLITILIISYIFGIIDLLNSDEIKEDDFFPNFSIGVFLPIIIIVTIYLLSMTIIMICNGIFMIYLLLTNSQEPVQESISEPLIP